MNYLGNVVDSFASDLLSSMGLQRRAGTVELLVPAIGGLAVGLLIGGAAALLFAPTSGAELREQLGERLQGARERAREAADSVRERVKRTTSNAGTGAGTRSNAE